MRLVMVGVLSLLAGCVSPEQIAANQAAFDSTVPVCEGDADCAAKWDAAQLWVVHNAGMKIQTSTNVVIETFNAIDSASTSLAVQVTKEPMGGGRYRILVKTWCNNLFGCVPQAPQAALDFNRTVGDATP